MDEVTAVNKGWGRMLKWPLLALIALPGVCSAQMLSSSSKAQPTSNATTTHAKHVASNLRISGASFLMTLVAPNDDDGYHC